MQMHVDQSFRVSYSYPQASPVPSLAINEIKLAIYTTIPDKEFITKTELYNPQFYLHMSGTCRDIQKSLVFDSDRR